MQADALHLPFRDDWADAVVTDPPAGIAFMGRKWDRDKGGRRQWVDWMAKAAGEAMRVVKPGAHGFFWSLPRTSHWTAWALEDSGWELRDSIVHVFASGFPKSLDVSKAVDKMFGAEREVTGFKDKGSMHGGTWGGEHGFNQFHTRKDIPATDEARRWDGWGTSLAPSYEQWWLVRKPLSERNVAANTLRWGTGGINIDAGRIQSGETTGWGGNPSNGYSGGLDQRQPPRPVSGRWPKNIVFSHHPGCQPGAPCVEGCPVGDLDRQSVVSGGQYAPPSSRFRKGFMLGECDGSSSAPDNYGDSGGASRFFHCFYTPKAPPSERVGVKHPTVKPLSLMEHLIRLVCPVGGIVLDPFAGSFTTVEAAMRTGRVGVGSDNDAGAFDDAAARLAVVQRGLF